MRARGGRWKEAIADFSRVRDLNPEDDGYWHALTGLFVVTGQLDAYREHCRKNLERFARTDDLHTAEQTAKHCLILPNSGVDLALVAKLAESTSGITNHWLAPWYRLVNGISEYPQGRFSNAVEWLNKVAIGNADPGRNVPDPQRGRRDGNQG